MNQPNDANSSPQKQPPVIRSGQQLPYFKPNKDRPSVGSSEDMNLIVAVCNAVLACRQMRISERNITIDIPPPATPAAQSDFAGVYVPGQTYNSFNWVVIQAGPGNGAYISTAENNANDPRTGINWIQFSALTQWF